MRRRRRRRRQQSAEQWTAAMIMARRMIEATAGTVLPAAAPGPPSRSADSGR